MDICVGPRKGFVFPVLFFILSYAVAVSSVWGETTISGKVVTSDGKLATSGVVALEKGDLHNNTFAVGGEIMADGSFKIPLSSGGPWGLHVYSEGYLYFPLQIHVKEGVDNEVPVILPLDGKPGDDPRISDIRFLKISDEVIRITMMVNDFDGNLGPQVLAIDKKGHKSYRMLPAGGDLKDKKTDFPDGRYVSPFIPAALDNENLEDWVFVVADHTCSNGPIYNGLNKSIFTPPIPNKEPLDCEVAGIWKSNFDKVYRFTRQSPGLFKGEQFDGNLYIDRMAKTGGKFEIDFQFEGKKGKATLRMFCKDNAVVMKGKFTLAARSGDWIFTKLKNEKTASLGQKLFNANCAGCHYPDRADTKVGPGLKGLFKNPRLPGTNRPTGEQTVRDQILKGGTKMPPFAHLKAEEISAIVGYLKNL